MPDNVLSDLCVLERMRLHMQAELDVPQFSVTKLVTKFITKLLIEFNIHPISTELCIQ